jgi:hypothetical protein
LKQGFAPNESKLAFSRKNSGMHFINGVEITQATLRAIQRKLPPYLIYTAESRRTQTCARRVENHEKLRALCVLAVQNRQISNFLFESDNLRYLT